MNNVRLSALFLTIVLLTLFLCGCVTINRGTPPDRQAQQSWQPASTPTTTAGTTSGLYQTSG